MAVATFAARAALEEVDIDYELEWLEPGEDLRDLVRGHPLGVLPYLALDDERGIADAQVIARYLERMHSPTLAGPREAASAARMEWIVSFASEEIGPSAETVFHGGTLAPVVGLEVDEARVEASWAWIAEPQPRLGGRSRFAILEDALRDEWFRAAPLDRAGLAVAAAFAPLALSACDLAAWPSLEKAIAALHQRDSFREQLEEVRELLAEL